VVFVGRERPKPEAPKARKCCFCGKTGTARCCFWGKTGAAFSARTLMVALFFDNNMDLYKKSINYWVIAICKAN
jgi:hypothetical protein